MSVGVSFALQRLVARSSRVSAVTRGVASSARRASRVAMAGPDPRASAPDGPQRAARRRLVGAVFDMDGTLTVPNLDFQEMYRRVGCETKDILSEIETWPEDRRARANAIVHEMEQEALRTMKRTPGAEELAAFFDARGIPRGLVTRNVQSSVAHFHAHAWNLAPFAPALARDFRPYKPAPDALLHISAAWDVHPSEIVMVGDSAKDDVVSGNRAGAITVLLDTAGKWSVATGTGTGTGTGGEDGDGCGGGEEEDETRSDNGRQVSAILEGEMIPTHIVRSLDEIAPLLEAHYDVVAPAPVAR